MENPYRKFVKYFIVAYFSSLFLGNGVFFLFVKNNPEPIPLVQANQIEREVSFEVTEVEFETTSEEILTFPPEVVKAVYLTSWSASIKSNIDYVIDIASSTEINAVVIDIKDFSGYVAYDTKLASVKNYGAEQIRLPDIVSIIQKLHDEGIYVIARITVFQDPVLARARPDLAVRSKAELSSETSTSPLWLDNLGLAWVDPAAEEVWIYNANIAREAVSLGFDELNFDYVRFPSDGNLEDMSFSFWDGVTPRHVIIKNFFENLRQELPDLRLSVDLFGLSTVNYDDLGIGQVIEDAYQYFDYVCPMVYPSHYAPGFQGYPEPAKYPYEVVKYSIEKASGRLKASNQAREVYLRPWLQDFNLGARYDAEMVRAQIKAVEEATGDNFRGFMLWNSWNVYTKDALRPFYQPPEETIY